MYRHVRNNSNFTALLTVGVSLFFELCLLRIHAYETTNRCPLNKTSWNDRAKTFKCDNADGLFYHCLKTNNTWMVETCLHLQTYCPKDGCPFVPDNLGSEVTNADIAFVKCKFVHLGCPKDDDSPFSSAAVYIYPACLVFDVQSTESRKEQRRNDLEISSKAVLVSFPADKNPTYTSAEIVDLLGEPATSPVSLQTVHFSVSGGVFLLLLLLSATLIVCLRNSIVRLDKKLMGERYTLQPEEELEGYEAHAYATVDEIEEQEI